MIEALVFDFDGLILDTETPIIQAWIALHNEAKIPCTTELAANVVGHVDLEFDPWVAFDPAIDRLGLEQEHKKRSRALLEQQAVLPGVIDCLAQARSRGLKTAIASNSSHSWVDRHLARLGLSSFFDRVKCREDVARGKPEPDVYEAVLREFKLTGPEAIAFEDSEAGSTAAKRAGLWCVAIPNPSTLEHDFNHVDLRLRSLAEMPLSELLGRFPIK